MKKHVQVSSLPQPASIFNPNIDNLTSFFQAIINFLSWIFQGFNY